ncbi:MAG: hypothetical protein HGB35_08825, partial [Geobacteraceae bacterium]|nr:hypothetical protein [Geobacteraceae bacterium]
MARSIRQSLLAVGLEFARGAERVRGVERIALLGSILTEKPAPKDIDFLLTVAGDANLEEIATLGRKMKGKLQGMSLGTDIFLCSPNAQYLGRTCSYRDCHVRADCGGADCRPGSWRRTDFHVITLSKEIMESPSLVLRPITVPNASLP